MPAKHLRTFHVSFSLFLECQKDARCQGCLAAKADDITCTTGIREGFIGTREDFRGLEQYPSQ